MIQDYYIYVVIFHQKTSGEKYSPIVVHSQLTHDLSNNCVHMLDPDMILILPILEYILQLPRFDLDLADLDESIIDKAWDEPHQIMIIPDSLKNIDRNMWNKILGCANSIFAANDVDILGIDFKPQFGIHRCSELGQNLLSEQWNQALSFFQADIKNKCRKILDYKPVYLSDKYLNSLPLLFFARQYGKTDQILFDVYHKSDLEIEKFCNRALWYLKLKQKTLVKLDEEIEQHDSNCEMTDDILEVFLKENYELANESVKNNCHLNAVVTFPGISKRQRKLSGALSYLPPEEKQAVRIMGLHRAIATNSAFIELPPVPDILYQDVDNIEQELKKPEGTNNPYIWRMLRKIGKVLKKQLTDEQEALLLQAPSVTVFSEFPLGLAILPGQQVPLSVSRCVYYEPITPLSRQITFELSEAGQLLLNLNCRILFVECIPDNPDNKMDHIIHNTSEELYKNIKKGAEGCPNVSLYHEEAYTVNDLKRVFNKYPKGTLEILIISAHGFYAEQNNFAGLCVGNEKWMANDNDFQVPPIVLLSACHVSPRGRNVVNAADLLIRAGARVIISTLIPVNVFRNLLIYTRLFVYIFEAIKGSKQYTTLADAWTGVMATNAVNEIIESSLALKKWYFEKSANGIPRIFEFTQKRCLGRIHSNSIYQDTIAVLKEMLKEDGMEGRFDSILDKENYFPESFFYQMIGLPETIFINNDIMSKRE